MPEGIVRTNDTDWLRTFLFFRFLSSGNESSLQFTLISIFPCKRMIF